jgi:beta-galactosidase
MLAVKVNNQLPSSRWYSGSGIYRHVWLKTVNPVHVAYTGTRVTTPQISTSSATVNISVTVKNGATSDQSVILASSIRDPSGAEVGSATTQATTIGADKTADVPQTVTVANPKLWSIVADPVFGGDDCVRERRGRRHVYDAIRHS